MKYTSRLVVSGFLFALTFGIFTTTQAAVLTIDKKSELIAALIAKITELQKQLAEMNAAAANPVLIVVQTENPVSRLLVAGDQYAEFTKVKLEAQGKDITIKGLTIMQTGFAKDAVFSYLGIAEDKAYVNAPHSDHTYFLKLKKPMVIKQGESKDITLYGAMALDLSGHDGELARLSLTGIDADAPLQGSLPIAGTFQTVNASYTIAYLTGTRGSVDPATNKHITLNSPGVIFSGVRFDLTGAEPITLNSLAWRQGGSASIGDISNLKTVVVYKGQTHEFTAVPREGDVRFYDSNFGDVGIRIDRGDSFDVSIKGDVGIGVNRTIDFNIDSNSDLVATGVNSSATIAPQGADVSGSTAAEGQTSDRSYPYYNGYQHTITGPFTNVTK